MVALDIGLVACVRRSHIKQDGRSLRVEIGHCFIRPSFSYHAGGSRKEAIGWFHDCFHASTRAVLSDPVSSVGVWTRPVARAGEETMINVINAWRESVQFDESRSWPGTGKWRCFVSSQRYSAGGITKAGCIGTDVTQLVPSAQAPDR